MQTKGKRLTENQQYEPLSQQVYTDLIAAIDKLFDQLKSDMSTVFGLKWEWQTIVLKHNRVLSESQTLVPLHIIVEGKRLLNELRYDLRENANTVIKINQVIELYRDKMKELVKQMAFKPKAPSREDVFQQFGQAWRNSPSVQQSWASFDAGDDAYMAQQKLEMERRKLAKERQDFEAEKASRGTGGDKGDPVNPPQLPPDAGGGAGEEGGGGEDLNTASPDTTNPKQKEKVIKLGFIVRRVMQIKKVTQVDDALVKSMMPALGIKDIDEVDISHMDEEALDKCLKTGEAYLALHGGGIIGALDTGMEPVPPEQAKGIEELITLPNKKLSEYLIGLVGQTEFDQVLVTYGGKIPRGSKKQEFITKVLERVPKKESLVHTLRRRLRSGARPQPKLCLEQVELKDRTAYLLGKLRDRS